MRELLDAAHSKLTFNAPLGEAHATALVARLPLRPGGHVLDAGCGWGELLLRIVAAHPAATGTGVDTNRRALDRGRRAAAERGLAERVEFAEADVGGFDDHGDLVVCVGSSHAWGNPTAALRALRDLTAPGGHVLFGEGFWERPPGADARRIFGDLPVYDGLQSVARAEGFVVVRHERSTQEEWDAFETTWRAGLEASGSPEAVALAIERKHEYEEGYRGVLGFAWLELVLA